MSKRVKQACLFLAFCAAACASQAQPTSKSLLFTADSLATGNAKDVFKSFFQLAFNQFIGDNKEFQFTANPFGVMAKINPNLLVDTNYLKYTRLRNLNFSFGAKLNSDYKFNGFSSGVKYALVNARDETASQAFVATVRRNQREYDQLTDSLNAYIANFPIGPIRHNIRTQINDLFNGDLKIGQLDSALKQKVMKLTRDLNIGFDAGINIRKISVHTYDSLKSIFQNRPLWTIGFSDTTYKDQFLFSNVLFSSEFVKGIVNPNAAANIEIIAKADWGFMDDTLRAGRDLRRSVFSFEPGLNFLLKVKETAKSFLEFKVSGTYFHTFSRLYVSERKDRLTLNGTLRIRVFDDIWIPLEIKYDPLRGNVFGFLNVRFNFNGQAKKTTPQT